MKIWALLLVVTGSSLCLADDIVKVDEKTVQVTKTVVENVNLDVKVNKIKLLQAEVDRLNLDIEFHQKFISEDQARMIEVSNQISKEQGDLMLYQDVLGVAIKPTELK